MTREDKEKVIKMINKCHADIVSDVRDGFSEEGKKQDMSYNEHLELVKYWLDVLKIAIVDCELEALPVEECHHKHIETFTSISTGATIQRCVNCGAIRTKAWIKGA